MVGEYLRDLTVMPNATADQINALLDSAETKEVIFFDKVTIISYRLPGTGFVVTGMGNAADPAKFDIEIGRECARQDAFRQLWPLETYRRQCEDAG